MITITIPNNNIIERKYVASTLFDYFIGVNYVIKESNINDTIISWDDSKIIIKDHFFSGLSDLTYLSEQYLPKVVYSKNQFTPESDIPVLFGSGIIELGSNTVVCDIDIFASVFFMLSRWEEYVVKKCDQYGRFIGKESIAYKYGFIHRPIVNEYAVMLKRMLLHLQFSEIRDNNNFTIIPTHDIDHPYMRYRWLRITKYILRSIITKDYNSIRTYIHDYFKDPYDVYNFLLETSESSMLKSHFYFMSASPDIDKIKECPYNMRKLKKIVEDVKLRGHIVGFHPGFFTADNEKKMSEEKSEIESILGSEVNEGRQHYLRFFVPKTINILENSKMRIDSSLSYHDIEGFRCGTGNEFPLFDFLSRCESQLHERPLIIMDQTLITYRKYSIDETEKVLSYYLNVGKKYQMPITILFHNSSFTGITGMKLRDVYKKTLSLYATASHGDDNIS